MEGETRVLRRTLTVTRRHFEGSAKDGWEIAFVPAEGAIAGGLFLPADAAERLKDMLYRQTTHEQTERWDAPVGETTRDNEKEVT